jgi:hypothetical protein
LRASISASVAVVGAVEHRDLDRSLVQRRAPHRLGEAAPEDQHSGSRAHFRYAQGELRAVHLRYHLLMLDVLTPAQVTKYSELRGYN